MVAEGRDTTVTPYDLWRHGVRLTEAMHRHGGGDAWAAEHAQVVAAFDRLRTDPRSPLLERMEATVRLQALAAAWERQERLLQAARDDLVARLAGGALIAVGFVGQASGGDTETLRPVPPAAWNGCPAVDWERSRLVAGAIRYTDVRVMDRVRTVSNENDGAAEAIDPASDSCSIPARQARGEPC